jgi:hypothetical protein
MADREIIKRELLELVGVKNGKIHNKFYELTLWSTDHNSFEVISRWGSRGDQKRYSTKHEWKTEGGTSKMLRRERFQGAANRFFNDQLRGKITKGYKKVTLPEKKKPRKKVESTMEEASLSRFSFIAEDL